MLAEDDQQIEDRRHEQAKHRLRLRIADEIADQPRTELTGGERQHHDRDRNDQRGHGDDARQKRPQKLACAFRVAAVHEPQFHRPIWQQIKRCVSRRTAKATAAMLISIGTNQRFPRKIIQ